jgi:hypothetical protein
MGNRTSSQVLELHMDDYGVSQDPHVKTATQLVAGNVLSAGVQDRISREMLAPYAEPQVAVIRAAAPASLIRVSVASSRIGLLDFLALIEAVVAAVTLSVLTVPSKQLVR